MDISVLLVRRGCNTPLVKLLLGLRENRLSLDLLSYMKRGFLRTVATFLMIYGIVSALEDAISCDH